MKQVYSFCIYGVEQPKSFTGLLGPIDLYCVQLLLAGGRYLVDEEFEGDTLSAIRWYMDTLKQQDIIIKSHFTKKIRSKSIIFLQVDLEQTPVHEFTQAHEVAKTDFETLAWKPCWIPCAKGTSKECLGFEVSTREVPLVPSKQKSTVHLQDIIEAVLK